MDKLDAYKKLHESSFETSMNANDFFHYACAQMVTIVEEDIDWVVEHIQEFGQEGVDSAMAYIQNQEPIKPHVTDKFNEAIKVLVDRKQEVIGDIDWEFHHYNENGPYRKINKYEDD
jgi:hypothetical protein